MKRSEPRPKLREMISPEEYEVLKNLPVERLKSIHELVVSLIERLSLLASDPDIGTPGMMICYKSLQHFVETDPNLPIPAHIVDQLKKYPPTSDLVQFNSAVIAYCQRIAAIYTLLAPAWAEVRQTELDPNSNLGQQLHTWAKDFEPKVSAIYERKTKQLPHGRREAGQQIFSDSLYGQYMQKYKRLHSSAKAST